jgi:hypothetical protein
MCGEMVFERIVVEYVHSARPVHSLIQQDEQV